MKEPQKENRFNKFWKERWENARDETIQEGIKWLLKGVFLSFVLIILGAFGINKGFFDEPVWWPWKDPPQTGIFSVEPNKIEGRDGYVFVSQAFDEIEVGLNGVGSLRFADSQIKNIRACFPINIPPQESPDRMLRVLIQKLSPCLKYSKSGSGRNIRHRIEVTTNEKVTKVKRANRGGGQPVSQYFCGCDDSVIDLFLQSPFLP